MCLSVCVCVCAWGSALIASVCVGECLSVLFVSMGLSCSAWMARFVDVSRAVWQCMCRPLCVRV